MKKLIIISLLLILLIALFVTYLYLNTTLFFKDIDFEPIKFFYSNASALQYPVTISQGNQVQQSLGTVEKYHMSSVTISITNPFQEANGEIEINFQNFTREVNFWYASNDYTGFYNQTAVNEYIQNTMPDILIFSSLFPKKSMGVWTQVWESQPEHQGTFEPFLTQTSFDTWEGRYYLDNKYEVASFDNFPFLPTTPNQLTFQINIPNGYVLENSNEHVLPYKEYFTISKTIGDAESIDIIVKNKNLETRKEVISIILGFGAIPVVTGILLNIRDLRLKHKNSNVVT